MSSLLNAQFIKQLKEAGTMPWLLPVVAVFGRNMLLWGVLGYLVGSRR